ncbi:tissue factor [Oncorhynchus mykiss]|uniref:Tissue factor n=1 Tax=Oncorhynchus mykiss TaxID=8022 RepID=A0A8C7UH84_ONCMY|nr:tissue factor [Oncorhynchus mykiss]
MMDVRTPVHFGVSLLSVLFTIGASGEDYFPEAQNVKWVSNNFKTILTWGPEPTNYTYTVEFSEVGKDRQRKPYCIRSSGTECDLTNELRNLEETYSADVLSEPLPGVNSDLVEFPYTRAERFCPYKDTQIGAPSFNIKQSEDKTKMTLHIQNPLTPIYKDDQLVTIRDIFKNDLKYNVIYNKAGSTGKKETMSDLRDVELNNLDKGESYCFMVAAYIPSRSVEKRLGDWSKPQCSPRESKTIFEEFPFGVIAGAIAIMLAMLIILITLTVVCCKHFCCIKKETVDKENLQLSPV